VERPGRKRQEREMCECWVCAFISDAIVLVEGMASHFKVRARVGREERALNVRNQSALAL
jgi:hypothetical protein